MKKVIDNFSIQAGTYKKFRPEYPKELYREILSHSTKREECWDCATGNGQVAKELSKYFNKVYASDISADQIKLAAKKPNIEYLITRAEKTPFHDDQFDLITVAQATHWFDFKAFNAEVKRVGKNSSKIIIWGYGLLRIEKRIDEIIQDFYTNTIGAYWDKERKHIDLHYESIEFDFKELDSPKNLSIGASWRLSHLIGYLNSWSSVQNYIKANGENPTIEIAQRLSNIWSEEEYKQINFPIFMRIGQIEK